MRTAPSRDELSAEIKRREQPCGGASRHRALSKQWEAPFPTWLTSFSRDKYTNYVLHNGPSCSTKGPGFCNKFQQQRPLTNQILVSLTVPRGGKGCFREKLPFKIWSRNGLKWVDSGRAFSVRKETL